MGLKLKALLEGYAWERKADGSLPTLKDAIAVHEANKAEKEPRWQDSDGDGKWYEPGDDVKEITEGHNDHGILDLVSMAEDKLQNLRKNMANRKPDSEMGREEKNGYLRAFDELPDILSDIGVSAEME